MLREEIGQTLETSEPVVCMSAHTELGGQPPPFAHDANAPHTELPCAKHQLMPILEVRTAPSLDDHAFSDTHNGAVIQSLIFQCRRYEDLERARIRLELQMQATARNICEGDKSKAAKLLKDPSPDVMVFLLPYLEAMAPLDIAKAAQTKVLQKLAKELPVWKWVEGVKGVAPYSLARIVGHAGRGLADYRNPSCLWKRMGLAVIGDGRQRRVTGDAALEHGYNASRRAFMWNVGECILKAQIRNPKDGEGNKTGRVAIGEYGQLYIDRRAHEASRCESDAHIHNRAKRYVEKRFLRDLWREWKLA